MPLEKGSNLGRKRRRGEKERILLQRIRAIDESIDLLPPQISVRQSLKLRFLGMNFWVILAFHLSLPEPT